MGKKSNSQKPNNQPKMVVHPEQKDGSIAIKIIKDNIKNNSDNGESLKKNLENKAKNNDESDEQIVAKNEDSLKEFVKNRRQSTNERDRIFNLFLKAYTDSFTKKSNQKVRLKRWFFILIMLIFMLILAIPVFIVLYLGNSENIASFIVAIVGSFIELFTAFLVLPRIIAEYLFNKEDNNMVTIIEKMQEYNLHQIDEEQHDKS